MLEEQLNEKRSSSSYGSSVGGGGVPPAADENGRNDDDKQHQDNDDDDDDDDMVAFIPKMPPSSSSSTSSSRSWFAAFLPWCNKSNNNSKSDDSNKSTTASTTATSNNSTMDFEYYQQLAILLVGLSSMGAALGFERSLLPRMAVSVFHETSAATIMNFVSAFGASKALANIVAGPLADRYGRKPILVFGFVIGLPVMPFVNYANSWTAVTCMNIAFGLSQGLIGSALFFLLIDVMGPRKRGIAVGLGECVIYISTAIVNILAGDLASRYGFRPVPFGVATGFALLGLVITIPLHDTLDQVQAEATSCSRENSHHNSHYITHDTNKRRISSLQQANRVESNVSEISSEGADIIASRKTTTPSSDIPTAPSPSTSTSRAVAVNNIANDFKTNQLIHNEQTPLLPQPDGAAITSDEKRSPPSSSMSSLIEVFDTDDSADALESATGIIEVGSTSLNHANTNVSNNNTTTDTDDDDDDDDDDDSECGRPMEGMGMHETSSLLEQQVLGFLTSRSGINFMILCLGGMAMNFKDGFAWGSFPLFFSEYHHLRNDKTDILVAVYPLCWGFSQAFTGAMSDYYGRKLFLMAGALSCTIAMALYTVPGILWGRPAGGTIIDDHGNDGSHRHFIVWVVADVLLGIGTAMSYPTLQAGVADEINPIHRGVGLGVYRFIRDMGYVVGASICGRLIDSIGYMDTFLVVTAVLGSSLLSIIFLYFPVHWSEKQWSVHNAHN
jgi:MFS family permease